MPTMESTSFFCFIWLSVCSTHRWLQEEYQFMWNFPKFSHISAVVMVMLPFKQTSQPSPKLIIVAPGVNAINGGHESLFYHMNSSTSPKDEHISIRNIRAWVNSFQNLVISQRQWWCCCHASKPHNPLQSSSLLPQVSMLTMEGVWCYFFTSCDSALKHDHRGDIRSCEIFLNLVISHQQ